MRLQKHNNSATIIITMLSYVFCRDRVGSSDIWPWIYWPWTTAFL